MHYFLRKTKLSIFTGSLPVTPERRQEGRNKFLLRPGETGLSVFEVSSDEDRDLVIAALACTQTRDDPAPYLALEDGDIRPFGVATPTLGTTVVPGANSLHRELRWTQDLLFALADHLLDCGKRAEPFGRALVRSCLLRLDPVQLTDEEARGWLKGFQEAYGGRGMR